MQTIVFLGQFGGTSRYLQQRMAKSSISSKVKIRYSQSGKSDVVRGALSERLDLGEAFVRGFKTRKSYGSLVTMNYLDPGVAAAFPDPQAHGAFPFEPGNDGPRLTVIEWAIAKVSGMPMQEPNRTDVAETSGHLRRQPPRSQRHR